MAADSTIVLKRVLDILRASLPRTFAATVALNNLERNTTAITEAVTEAALEIAQAIISNPKHYHRNLFISATPVTLTNQGELPDYGCEFDPIEIERYTSAGYRRGIPVDDPVLVEEYRANPSSAYDAIAHDTTGSLLGGFYAVQNNRIYFTGLNCRGYFPVIARGTVTGLIPDEYEGAWIALGVGLSAKKEDETISRYYMQIGNSALSAINQQGIVPPLPDYKEVSDGR